MDLKKEADRLFSLWVRQSNSVHGIVHCCTCNKPMMWRDSHCGHFMSRRSLSTRFLEKNTAPQCTYCNTFDQGKQYEFSLYLDAKYGKGTAESMLIKSKMTAKISDFEYKDMIEKLKRKLKENNFLIR
jgi:hypothetical protein